MTGQSEAVFVGNSASGKTGTIFCTQPGGHTVKVDICTGGGCLMSFSIGIGGTNYSSTPSFPATGLCS